MALILYEINAYIEYAYFLGINTKTILLLLWKSWKCDRNDVKMATAQRKIDQVTTAKASLEIYD